MNKVIDKGFRSCRFVSTIVKHPVFGRQGFNACKRDEIYFTTSLWQNSGWQNGLISRMLFSELYKIVVNKITFLGFRGRSPQLAPLDPSLCEVGLMWRRGGMQGGN